MSWVCDPNTLPKPSRKSIGTPITTATSASPNAFERAREKASGWSAGTTPRAIPFISTGICRCSARRSNATSPRPHQTLVPAMITGRCAADSSSQARSRASGSAPGGAGRSSRAPGRPEASDMDKWENTWSIGKSTKPTPDGAPTVARNAWSTSRPAASADCAVAAKRVSGATNGT